MVAIEGYREKNPGALGESSPDGPRCHSTGSDGTAGHGAGG